MESIDEYITACSNPTKAIISIGATRYTKYGESTFLQKDDEIIIALYNTNDFSKEEAACNIKNNLFTNMSVLAQKIT